MVHLRRSVRRTLSRNTAGRRLRSVLDRLRQLGAQPAHLRAVQPRLSLQSLNAFKVVEIGTDRKPLCDFLLVANGNLSRILYRFRDIATKSLEIYIITQVLLMAVSFKAL